MIWLKLLIIEIALSPLIYIMTIMYVKALIFIGRNTKGIIKTTLLIINVAVYIPFVLAPMFVPLIFEDIKFKVQHNDVFLMWILMLFILSLSPSFFYFYKKRRRELEESGFFDN